MATGYFYRCSVSENIQIEIKAKTLSLFQYFFRSAHMQLNMLADVDCHLRPTGEIYCFPLVNVVTYCIADLLYFPFDKQNCTLLFSSVGYLGKYVNVSLFDPLHGVSANKNPFATKATILNWFDQVWLDVVMKTFSTSIWQGFYVVEFTSNKS